MSTDAYRDALARLQAHYESEVNGRRNDAIVALDNLIAVASKVREAVRDCKPVPNTGDLRHHSGMVPIRLSDLNRAQQALAPIKREIRDLGMPE